MKSLLNVGEMDRIIRLLVGIALAALAYFGVFTGTAAIIAYVVAVIAIATGLFKICLIYKIIGINTSKIKSS
jgi:hypothetical protein